MTGPPKKSIALRTSLPKTLGFLAILASGFAVFAAYTEYEIQGQWLHASETVATEANLRTAALEEWLLRIDRTLGWFRAEDMSTADRFAVTVRLLRNERVVAPAQNLFLVSPTGRMVAGTLPLPDGSAAISARRWPTSPQDPARAGLQLTGCTQDPFGGGEGVLVYRALFDHDAVIGYAGSFLPEAAIAGLLRNDDPANGKIRFALRLPTGEALGCHPTAPPVAASTPGMLRGWLSAAIGAWPEMSQRAAVRNEQVIEPGGLHLIGKADVLDTMSEDDWTALGYRVGYVATSLLLIMSLLSSVLNRQGGMGRLGLPLHAGKQAADGADWMWELDDTGAVVGLAGNVPEHLLPPSGRSLVEMAGPLGSKDLRWGRLNAALCAKHAFEGLQVPFQIPGRTGLLTIFAFSGQPVITSGGFWGTASLVSEESVARSAQPALSKPVVSAA